MPRGLAFSVFAITICLPVPTDAQPSGIGEPESRQRGTDPAETNEPPVAQNREQKQAPAATLESNADEHFQAGRYAKAVPLLEQAIEFRRGEGEKSADYVVALNNLATAYLELGDFAKAEPLYREAQTAARDVLGADHREYVAVLYNLAALYSAMGRYNDAEPLFKDALTIRKATLGESHPDVATSLDGLAGLYQTMGNYAQAEELYREALAIQMQSAGEDSVTYASSLNNLGSLYKAKGEYTRAEPLFQQASGIVKKLLGGKHPNYAASLNNLASLYRAMGKFPEAVSRFQEALAITEEVLGREHPYYAGMLHNLAGLYQEMGEPTRAEPLLRQSLAIQRKVFGDEHPQYATGLDVLAGLYEGMADYAQAEPLYQQSLAIRREAFGVQHADYATSLNLLAGLYQLIGDYDRAEPLLLQALSTYQAALGERHPEYARVLNNLASLYASTRRHAQAESLYRRVLVIQKEAIGEAHPDYAATLNNLASVYESIGRFTDAESLYLQVLAHQKEVLGHRHPNYASTLNNLAYLHHARGETTRAQSLYEQALDIMEEVFGRRHPDYAMGLNNLASVYFSNGEFARAEPLSREAVAITTRILEAAATGMDERQQLAHSQRLRYALDNYARCLLQLDSKEGVAHWAVLNFKGSVVVRQRALRRAARHPEVADLVARLQSVTRQWAALARLSPNPNQVESIRQRRQELESAKEGLEKELARKSPAFREATRIPTPEDLAAALPDDSVLVDYFVGMQDGNEGILLAFVLSPAGDIQAFDLGPLEAIAGDIRTWRAGFGRDTDAADAGARLRERVWQPLAGAVGDAKTVLISPDGILGTLPFAALPGADPGTYLLEKHRLVVVPVPRLLEAASAHADLESPSNDLLIMGGIDYDRIGEGAAESLLLAKTDSLGTISRSVRFVTSGQKWDPLPGAAVETAAIQSLYRSRSDAPPRSIVDLSGATATEAAFRQYAPQCRHVHVATHGFYSAVDIESPVEARLLGAATQFRTLEDAQQQDTYRPGLHCGMVFAGANNPPPLPTDPDKLDEIPDDGILTADEIACLTMDGVELVVLSACETGLGEVAGGEGLLGLQRAFQVAGAKATIASLWKVPDDATSDLMAHFYTNLWQKQMPPIDALRQAQLSILNGDPLPSAGRDRGPSGQRRQRVDSQSATTRRPPREWAAWVLSGNTGY